MKRLTIFLFILIMSTRFYAQVEKILSTDMGYGYVYKDINKTEVVKYFTTKTQSGNSNVNLSIINTDFSVYKNIDIQLPTGFLLDGFFCTTQLFNRDENIEVFVDVKYATNIYSSLVYTDNGELFYDFGEGRRVDFVRINDEFLYRTLSGSSTLNYFVLSKKQNTNIAGAKSLVKTMPYPNPAAQTINLPYQLNSGEQTDMQIFDVNGKLVATKRIDSAFDKIVLNVSGYEKGMYVYKYNNKSAKFVVE